MRGAVAARLRAFLGRDASAEDLLAAVLLVFVPLSFLYGAVLVRLDPPEKNDFTSYYVAAHVLKRGMPDALYYPEPVGSLLAQATIERPWADVARDAGVANPNYYLYPPLFAAAALPLAWLPYEAAFRVWLVANVVFLAAALVLFLRSRARVTPLGAAACVLLAGTSYPVWNHLKIGQSSLLVLLLLAACLSLLRRGRDVAAGIALSGAILLKLTPAILLALLVVRARFRAAAAAAAGAAGLILLSGAVAGPEPLVTYATRMVPLLSAGTAFYPNQSLNGFLTRLMGMGDYRKADLSLDLAAPRLAAAVLGAAVVIASLAAAWRRRREEGPEPLEDGFASLVLASLLISPISWEHHYVLALIPAWILAARWSAPAAVPAAAPWIAGIASALAGSYVGVKVFEKFGPGPLRPLLSSAALIGGAALWGIVTLGRARPAAAARPAAPPVLVFAAVYAAAQFGFKVAEYNTSFEYGDFTSYYVAAAAVVEGKGRALYAPDTPDDILAKAVSPSEWRSLADARGVRDANYYLYPPFFALLVSPLALTAYGAAHDLWYLVNAAALGGFLVWLVRSSPAPAAPAETALAVVLAALAWPSLFTFGAGQANFLILLLIFGGLLAAERGREAISGLALAAAAAVKLTPALLPAYFLWRRRRRIAAWAAAGAAALALLGIAAAGWEANRLYATGMAPLLSRGCAHWVNQSISALLSRLEGVSMFDWSVAPASAAVRTGSLAAALGFVAAAAALTRGASPAALRIEFALVLVTTLFVSPISWIHHAVLVLPAIVFLAGSWIREGRLTWGRAIGLAAAFTLVGIYLKPPGLLQAKLLTPLASYHLAGQVLLWGLLAAELLHLGRRARAAA